MIDLHTHILFDVDDGAKSLDESLLMLEAAKKIGIHSIVLTPHVSKFRTYCARNDDIISKYELLKKEANHLDINLYLGAEVDEDEHLIKTITKNCTLNDTNYVLVDFSMRYADISEIIYELKHYGYKVIIAHPERIMYLKYEDLVSLKNEGALFQVSSKHLVGLGNKNACKIAKQLLRDDLIDVVSSDAHDIQTLLSMKKAFEHVSKKKDHLYAKKLFVDNPFKIINKHKSEG